ncbi:MAG: hypothetical protein Q4E02_00225 [Lagierella massiliensis]|nr:hypothetical protein [Lagierella massiliensis]
MRRKGVKGAIIVVFFLFLAYVIIGTYRINKKYPDYIEENFKIGDKFAFGENDNILIKMTDIRFEDYPQDLKDNKDFEKMLIIDFQIENRSDKDLGFTPLIFSLRNEDNYINGVNYEALKIYNELEELSKIEGQNFIANSRIRISLPYSTNYLESKKLKKEELKDYYIVVSQYPKFQKIYLRR